MLKKFSKITGVQVGEKDTNETDFTGPSHQEVLQTKVLSLIDDFLRIRSVGAARKSILPHVIIDGKEDLASAIVMLKFNCNLIQAVTSLMENLKKFL